MTIEARLPGLSLLRRQVRQCHADLDDGAAAWLHTSRSSPPWPHPIRLYLHALCIEDITVQSVLRDDAPLFASLWPNLVGPADMAALRQYAQLVYASTDAYLNALPADGLSRVVDLSELRVGQRTVVWVTSRFVVRELGSICSAISSAVGL